MKRPRTTQDQPLTGERHRIITEHEYCTPVVVPVVRSSDNRHHEKLIRDANRAAQQ